MGDGPITPEDIVAMIGNISNREDIRKVQEKQVQAIYELIALAKTSRECRKPCTLCSSCLSLAKQGGAE